mgnify:FL=1|jgi:hypothetical protein
MSTKKDYTFSVETIRAGQPRPYADSVYEYIVKSELHEGIVRAFCTCVLRLQRQRKEDWKSFTEDPSSFFNGYYTFQKIDENTYKYYVFEPFCD